MRPAGFIPHPYALCDDPRQTAACCKAAPAKTTVVFSHRCAAQEPMCGPANHRNGWLLTQLTASARNRDDWHSDSLVSPVKSRCDAAVKTQHFSSCFLSCLDLAQFLRSAFRFPDRSRGREPVPAETARLLP